MTERIDENTVEYGNILPNPWRRYFARSIDIGLYSCLVACLVLIVLRWPARNDLIINTFYFMTTCIIMLFIEPLLLSSVGTTPGKWIFGLVLRSRGGNKLTYFDAIFRTFYVIAHGYGFGIPFYKLYRNYKSYRTCADGQELSWDEGFSYDLKDTKSVRMVGFIISWCLILFVLLATASQSKLPLNRGNITPEEYFENCNVFIKQNELSYGKLFNDQGEWAKINNSNSSTIHINLRELPEHTVVYNSKIIEKVLIEIETDGKVIDGFNDHLVMSFVSLVGSDKSINSRELFSKEYLNYFKEANKNFDFEIGEFIVKKTITSEGYRDLGSHLFAVDDQEQYFHMLFEIVRK